MLGREGTREEKGKGGGGEQRRIPRPFRRLCSTLSDMLTDRRSDARTNLFSIRPMHFKLIVPRSRYPVVILCLVLLKHVAGTIIVAGKSAVYSIFSLSSYGKNHWRRNPRRLRFRKEAVFNIKNRRKEKGEHWCSNAFYLDNVDTLSALKFILTVLLNFY